MSFFFVSSFNKILSWKTGLVIPHVSHHLMEYLLRISVKTCPSPMNYYCHPKQSLLTLLPADERKSPIGKIIILGQFGWRFREPYISQMKVRIPMCLYFVNVAYKFYFIFHFLIYAFKIFPRNQYLSHNIICFFFKKKTFHDWANK